jgi:hypothetical protein
MNSNKEARKALRQRLSQAIASVLAVTPEVDAVKASKAVRKSAGQLAKKVIHPVSKAKKAPAAQKAVKPASASPVAPEGHAKPDGAKKNKRKNKDKQAAVVAGKRTAQLVS